MLAWEWEIGGERLRRLRPSCCGDWCGLWNWAGLCPISSRMALVFVPGLTWLAPGALRQLLWRWLWLQPASAPAKVSILARPRSIILQNCKTVKLQCKLWTVFSEAERETGQKLCALLSALLIMLCPSTPFSTVAATWRCCCCWLFLATAKVLLHNLRFNKAKTI